MRVGLTGELSGSLADVVGRATGATVIAIDGLERLTGGSSREIWSFDAELEDGTRLELVLRRDPPGEQRTEELVREIDVMGLADRAGVPVPSLFGGSSDAREVGGIVMERISAPSDPREILRSAQLATGRKCLADDCGRALGRLHTVDASELGWLERVDRLGDYRSELDRLDRGRPVLELAYQWLIDHRPPPRPDVVVHGDFRLGNLAVDERGLRAVFDWESAHRGDRLEDLGWIAVKTWRFRGQGTIGGFGDVEPFLDAYAATTGVHISEGEFDWALMLNTWIWAVGTLQQADRHLSGRQRSLDLALVGRRVVEVEADLLELLS
jgi:aminoglycoside phosphotransferase (APT) family kinase protein